MKLPTILAATAFTILLSGPARAHCDGLDGPVVSAARQALAQGNVSRVLIWVQAPDEAEVRNAFAKTMAVRTLNPEARGLADQYFFETLVRLHRAGEGAAYTGLKAAGRDLGAAIPAADKAVAIGSDGALVKMLTEASIEGLHQRFQKVMATKNFKPEDVQAGREHVKAYVEFVHYVEGLHMATRRAGHEEEHSH